MRLELLKGGGGEGEGGRGAAAGLILGKTPMPFAAQGVCELLVWASSIHGAYM